MDNWENKILANKLDNLRDLPAGYTPNLSSKWEIVEAGLPGNKKRRIPLYIRWSVAAAVLLAIGLVWMNVHNNQANNYAVKPVNIQSLAKADSEFATLIPNPTTAIVPVHEETNQSNQSRISRPETVAQSTLKHTSILILKDTNRNQNGLPQDQSNTIAQENISLSKAQIILPDTGSIFMNEVATIASQEKAKPVKKKVYQRDFNDGVLAMDTGFTNTSSQHFSIRLLPFGRKTSGNNEPSARQMQLKTSF